VSNVLDVLEISKHLLSVQKLSRDNNVFFEFHPWYYFIKDRATRKLLLEGKCESSLYPLKPSDVESLHQTFVGRINGMLSLVIHLLKLFSLFCVLIISLVSRSLVCLRFVMFVNWLKVISYLIILLLIVLPCLFKLFILMFGVPLQFLLVVTSIISILLMTLQNSHGFIL
jgi:hypothetical protein